ncbi:hypothetical protein M5K25_009920 [Dendrobium thyrsiflorum]|uniref:NB-ARC domain-containing protein n=1 Tax=Dendrobium thyrsiflorum TaxID=117978 RepID=A0ABD0V6S2_DENTH
MGKTTLLQHVYEEDEMTEESDLKMSVCVSNNFDVKRVIADMLECLKMNRPPSDTLYALQKSLKSEKMSKKLLCSPLCCGSLGSKILVTTRMDSAALIIAKVIKKKKETLRLQGLDEDECLQLLNSHAFADVENLDDQRKLKLITEEIAKKLSGFPLAAKVMGGILNSNLDERHWRKVLQSDTGSIKLGQNDIMPVLRLSYLPILKYLLRNMPKAKLLDNKFHRNGKGSLFPSLKVLEIENLRLLEDWFDAAEVAEGDSVFPCLTELYLRNCQHLQELPFLPPKLMKLEIDNIGWKSFNWLDCASHCCIQEMKITRNDELVSVFHFQLRQSSGFFKLVHPFISCTLWNSNPCSLFLSPLASIFSLKILHVRNAPQLQMLPNIPTSVEKLVLDNLKSLQCLSSSLSISSLAVLELDSIPLLKSLPDLPPSLCTMNIYYGKLYYMPSCLPSLSYLQELPELPSSLWALKFINLESLQTLPSSLIRLSSLKILDICNVTQL